MEPRVDILLPTFNGEDFIDAQIESILSQSYLNIRLIVRDDSSHDNTVGIVEKFALRDSRVFFVKDKRQNIGLVSSIQLLLQFSDSSLIMFSDQDDVWFPNKVELFLNRALLEDQNSLFLIHSDSYVTNRNLKVLKRFLGTEPLNFGLENCLFKYYVQGSSSMINIKLKDECLPFPASVYLHDRYFHILSELKGKRIYIDQPTMYYRQHQKNMIGSQSLLKKILSSFYVWNMRFYFPKDKELILSIFRDQVEKIKIFYIYEIITDDKVNRFRKIFLIFRNKISLRMKEFLLLLVNN